MRIISKERLPLKEIKNKRRPKIQKLKYLNKVGLTFLKSIRTLCHPIRVGGGGGVQQKMMDDNDIGGW